MKSNLENLNQAAAFIDACSNFVAQLDKHQTGGAMFVCCVALALVGVVVVALTVPLRAALTSHDNEPKAAKSNRRMPHADDNSRHPEGQQRRQLSATSDAPSADNSRQRKLRANGVFCRKRSASGERASSRSAIASGEPASSARHRSM
ncbi:hypothetical protein PXJ20_32115 [Paraburkholderia sp. A1RI_3L]|uniref:hypothetical protein n=1 Tax=Paraburkholderia TaxID=1822464 RepID=UPI003B7BBAF3